jgi:hypothetical protein
MKHLDRKSLRTIGALTLLILLLGVSMVSAQDSSTAELGFVNHLVAGMPEPDVLLETETGEVMRIPVDAPISAIGQSVYTSTTGADHDMFMLGDNPLGPYEKGEALGMTLGEWLTASGSGTYTVMGDVATVEASLKNMVPNGVYTVWCSRVFVPPNFQIVNKPCGADDGSENVVVADAEGNLSFSIETFVLELTSDEAISLVALAYHSDGQTWGFDPGTFGLNSHVQVFAPIVFMG